MISGGKSRHRVGAVDILNVLNVLQAISPAGKGGDLLQKGGPVKGVVGGSSRRP